MDKFLEIKPIVTKSQRNRKYKQAYSKKNKIINQTYLERKTLDLMLMPLLMKIQPDNLEANISPIKTLRKN